MLPVVAIVGRPNVGKSTLFNRILGDRKALVHDRPGVTRDRNYATASWMDRSFLLIDTGGYDPQPLDSLYVQMRAQAQAAIAEADVVIFMVDRQDGLALADEQSAQLIRAAGRPVLIAVNKCDATTHDDDVHAFWTLGFGEPLAVSAEHGRGLYTLMDAVLAHLPPETVEAEPDPSEIRVAVLGQPNVGKSTLLNRLLGADRHIVDDRPGTTVDSTDTLLTVGEQRFRLIDTAGVRRRARIEDRVEVIAVSQALRAIERAHVVLFVLDGNRPPSEQDARLLGLVEERGRASILLINKWDQVRETGERDAKAVEEEVRWRLPHAANAPLLFLSALTGRGCTKVLDTAVQVYSAFNQRISTARLNQFLRAAVAAYSPPQTAMHPVRLSYMAQVRVRPPTFTVWCNAPEGVKSHYDRYLQNRLRGEFGFMGTPLRIQYRKKRKIGEEPDADAPPRRHPDDLDVPGDEGEDGGPEVIWVREGDLDPSESESENPDGEDFDDEEPEDAVYESGEENDADWEGEGEEEGEEEERDAEVDNEEADEGESTGESSADAGKRMGAVEIHIEDESDPSGNDLPSAGNAAAIPDSRSSEDSSWEAEYDVDFGAQPGRSIVPASRPDADALLSPSAPGGSTFVDDDTLDEINEDDGAGMDDVLRLEEPPDRQRLDLEALEDDDTAESTGLPERAASRLPPFIPRGRRR